MWSIWFLVCPYHKVTLWVLETTRLFVDAICTSRSLLAPFNPEYIDPGYIVLHRRALHSSPLKTSPGYELIKCKHSSSLKGHYKDDVVAKDCTVFL